MPNQGKTRRKQKHPAGDPNLKEQEPIAKGNPSVVIKSVCKTHLTQRVTPSRKNTNETNRQSLRSNRVGEPTTDTRPRQGWPHRKGSKETQPTEADSGLNEDGERKQNHDNGGVSETGDRQQSTQPQGNQRRMSKPRRTLWRSLPRGKNNHQAAKTPEEQERKEGREPNRDNPKAQNKDNPGKSTPDHGGTAKLRNPWRNPPTNRGKKAGTHYQLK